MSVWKIYTSTMKFIWMKLLLGIGTALCAVIWMGFCLGLAALFNNSLATIILLGIGLIGISVLFQLLMNYFGYLIKAGHVAIVATAVSTGTIPDNQFEAAKSMVLARFATSNVYFVIDKLVSGAVKQLQNVVGSVEKLFGNIPGVSLLLSFSRIFISLSLGYVDECCLGYTFCNTNDNAYKCAADGVVIYAQNWKRLLKDAALMSLVVIASVTASTLLLMALFGGLFSLLHWPGTLAFIVSFVFAIVIKTAFIDSYMMVKMMVSYMEVVPQTQISFDLYEKFCGLSTKFKELINKGRAQAPQVKSAS